jgi:hypothetical protein
MDSMASLGIPATVDASAGSDTLVLYAADTDETVDIATASVTIAGFLCRYFNTESLYIYANGGNDTIHLNSTAPSKG